MKCEKRESVHRGLEIGESVARVRGAGTDVISHIYISSSPIYNVRNGFESYSQSLFHVTLECLSL